MGRLIDLTKKMRMDNIRPEIPKFWRNIAIQIDPNVDIEGMRNVLRGKSHEEEFVAMFEKIVIKNRAMNSILLQD